MPEKKKYMEPTLAHEAIMFYCPHCCKINFYSDTLKNLGKKFNDQSVESDNIFCKHCGKDVDVIRFI